MGGSAGRVDVVHEENGAGERPRDKGVGHVSAPLGERKPALPSRPADPGEERLAGQLPRVCECAGELLGRVVAPPKPAFTVGWDEGHPVDVGPPDLLPEPGRRNPSADGALDAERAELRGVGFANGIR